MDVRLYQLHVVVSIEFKPDYLVPYYALSQANIVLVFDFQDRVGCLEDRSGRNATRGGDASASSRYVYAADRRAPQTPEAGEAASRQESAFILTFLRICPLFLFF